MADQRDERRPQDWTHTGARPVAALIILFCCLAAAPLAADSARFDPGARQPGAARPMLINVNAAPESELRLLPGVGPAIAARIVDDRLRNGRYTTISDLERVERIGPRTARKISPYAAFGNPNAPPR